MLLKRLLESVEIGEARGIGAVSPAISERTQPIAHSGIRMHRARLERRKACLT